MKEKQMRKRVINLKLSMLYQCLYHCVSLNYTLAVVYDRFVYYYKCLLGFVPGQKYI